MNRRVAFIAGTSFPPVGNASVHRVVACLRHLPSFGWDVDVFTLPEDYRRQNELDRSLMVAAPTGSAVYRVAPIWPKKIPSVHTGTGNADVRGLTVRRKGIVVRVASWLRDWLLLPDARATWVLPAFQRLRAVHRRQPYDAVISTSQENSSHIVGLLASAILHLPWVADFQDPWRSPWIPRRHPAREWLDHLLATIVVDRSDALIATSHNVGRSLSSEYDISASLIDIIPNGFEPRVVRHEPAKQGEKFSIVHTGRFYGRRTPESFLHTIDALVANHPDVESQLLVRFIGSFDEVAAAGVRPYTLRSWLELVDPLPHDSALAAQAEADLLLLVPGEQSMSMPGKIYEYLSAGRPLLCLSAEDSDAAMLLRELGYGTVIDPQDELRLEQYILEALLRGGEWSEPQAQDGLRAYHWTNIVWQISNVLGRVVGQRTSPWLSV